MARKALRQVVSMMHPDDHLVLITVKESAVKLDSIESTSKAICDEFGISH